MRKVWITALVWLLIVAVPVQGYAVARMVNCGALDRESAEHSIRSADRHDHHQSTSTGLGHPHDYEATVEAGAAYGHESPDNALSTNASCSACASCCVGVGFPAYLNQPIFRLSSSSPRFEAVRSKVDAVVNGPERPPRFIFV